jgi:3-methyladenine DNA glycosylase AlkC
MPRSRSSLHPAQRFRAPQAMAKGVPLKDVFGPELIRLIGESFAQVHPDFNRKHFTRRAAAGLTDLEFNARGRHIGLAIAEQLPQPFAKAWPILQGSFGPVLTETSGNGLAPFFYLPHSYVIAEAGIDNCTLGLRACYELTQRFSGEFCIRPFLVRYRDAALRELALWTSDSSPHVRRLVSEGSRPRLPWGMRLREFQNDPNWTLPLLEKLKDDPELYVRRSVANHLGDLLKDHPDVIYALCHRWLREVRGQSIPDEVRSNRHALVRHAVRLPAKQGDEQALQLRSAAR